MSTKNNSELLELHIPKPEIKLQGKCSLCQNAPVLSSLEPLLTSATSEILVVPCSLGHCSGYVNVALLVQTGNTTRLYELLPLERCCQLISEALAGHSLSADSQQSTAALGFLLQREAPDVLFCLLFYFETLENSVVQLGVYMETRRHLAPPSPPKADALALTDQTLYNSDPTPQPVLARTCSGGSVLPSPLRSSYEDVMMIEN